GQAGPGSGWQSFETEVADSHDFRFLWFNQADAEGILGTAGAGSWFELCCNPVQGSAQQSDTEGAVVNAEAPVIIHQVEVESGLLNVSRNEGLLVAGRARVASRQLARCGVFPGQRSIFGCQLRWSFGSGPEIEGRFDLLDLVRN